MRVVYPEVGESFTVERDGEVIAEVTFEAIHGWRVRLAINTPVDVVVRLPQSKGGREVKPHSS